MDHNGDLYGVLDFYIHQDYNKTVLFSNDIAIILSNKHLKLGPKAQRALIANSGKWMKENNENFEAIGWGWTEVSKKKIYLLTLRKLLKSVFSVSMHLIVKYNLCKYMGEIMPSGPNSWNYGGNKEIKKF